MKSFHDCIPCFVNQTLAAVRQVTSDGEIQERVLKKVLKLASGMDMNEAPPVMGQRIHRIIREETGNPDPYRQKKKYYNQWAESAIPVVFQLIEQQHEDLFEINLRLAIAGNRIDFGKDSSLCEADVVREIGRCFQAPLDTQAVARLRREIANAGEILYLGDNAGEVVFDRLFIEQLPMEKVTFVVRGRPVINDVTREDAEAVRMPLFVRVIDNGSDAPGTVLPDCSPEFRERFERADLVIAKGQGNYETLNDADKNIFFILQAKCPVIARDIGCEIGSYIIIQKKEAKNAKR